MPLNNLRMPALLSAAGMLFASASAATVVDQGAIALVALSNQSSIKWSVMNDPVMGGQSHSALKMTSSYGSFSGTCAIVPFLKAPGFCKIATDTGFFHPHTFPDASKFIAGSLYIEIRSTMSAYKGYKVAFSAKNITRPRPGMHHAGPSFKADFSALVPPSTMSGEDWSTVKIPFSSFSVDWSEFTGECDTKDPTGEQHFCCTTAHPEVCPKDYHLRQLTGFEIWAEGIEGQFAIDVRSISAGP